MFDFVGKHKRLLQFFLALIIVPTFAFFGIQSYEGFFGARADVAEVAGQPITVQEFESALIEQRNRMRDAFGGAIDPDLFDTPEARRELLDAMIDRRLLLDFAYRHKMFASDEQVREFIANYPAFQSEGRFSRERYEALLRAQNLSPAGFEAQLRTDIALEQLSDGVSGTAFVSRTMAERFARARAERRQVARALVTTGEFAGKVSVAPEEIDAYYAANPGEFEIPAQVRAAYVVLTREALASQVTVSEEEVRKFYDESVAPQAKAREEARAKAQALLDELRKEPDRFAELARQHSDDPGSAQQGGDLGFFGRGMMVKPFEDAVWKLKPGQISPLVETEFGFHIIRLDEVKPGRDEERRASHILISAPRGGKDFAGARAEIEAELKAQRLARLFPEAAETFSNLAYEQPDTLQPLVDRFGLEIQESGWLSAGAGRPPFDNPRLLEALFSPEVVEGGQNTEAVEVAPGQLVVARVIEHKPASKRPLEAVRDEIRKTLLERKAVAQAREEGARRLEALRKGEQLAVNWGAPRDVSRENPGGLEPEALAAVFKVDASKLPAYVGVETASGYALYRVSAVEALQQVDEQRVNAAANALTQLQAREQFRGFLDGLRERADVEVNEQQLLRVGSRQ